VLDLAFGDSGKGKVVSYLCSRQTKSLVVRFSGGHQAGHHVVIDPKLDHVCTNWGSGTLQGKDTYWSKFCTVDPVGCLREMELLSKKVTLPTLFIDGRCPITTPYEILKNKEDEKKYKHGTCGIGFGQTIQREEDRYSLKFADLFNPTIFKIKMNMLSKYYGYPNEIFKDFFKACKDIIHMSCIKLTFGKPNGYREEIYEGSQGLLLDQDIGFFPHVTRSNTGSKNLLKLTQFPEYYLVTRAYQTRHGNGPMTNEKMPHYIPDNPYEKNNDIGIQGKFRKSILDLDLLKYAIEKDSDIRQSRKRTLVITCLDLMKNNWIFTENGKIVTAKRESRFVRLISNALGIKNVLLSRSPLNTEMEEF